MMATGEILAEKDVDTVADEKVILKLFWPRPSDDSPCSSRVN